MQRIVSGRAAMHALAVVAGLALGLGAAVYLVDRPAGSAWLIPSAWQAATPARWFGAMGDWLPTFVHAFAFSILTACLLPRLAAFAAAACLGWALVDSLAEVCQRPDLAAALAGALAAVADHAPVAASLAARIGRYFTQGSFDPADLAAGPAGSALAFLALHHLVLRPAAHRTTGPQGTPTTLSITRLRSPT